MREEVENLSESDKKLCQMLAELGKVEAPKDFEFRVKARIAKANPRAYQNRRAWRLGYVLPATGLAAMLAFAGIYSNFSGGSQNNELSEAGTTPRIEQIVQPAPSATSEVALSSNSNVNTANAIGTSIGNTTFAVNPKNKTIATPSPNRTPKGSLIKSNLPPVIDSTSSQPKVLNPRGLNPESKKLTPNSEVKEQDFSVQDMFKTLGVETVQEKGVLKVKSLSDAATRSGLKYGDEIESINEQKITNGKIRGKKVDLKKIGVKRGTETVQIDLQAKPQQ